MLHVPVTVSPAMSAFVRFLTESHMSSQDFGSGIVGVGVGRGVTKGVGRAVSNSVGTAVGKGVGRTVGTGMVLQHMTMMVV